MQRVVSGEWYGLMQEMSVGGKEYKCAVKKTLKDERKTKQSESRLMKETRDDCLGDALFKPLRGPYFFWREKAHVHSFINVGQTTHLRAPKPSSYHGPTVRFAL